MIYPPCAPGTCLGMPDCDGVQCTAPAHGHTTHDDWRWANHAELAECDYCGTPTATIPDPFGQKPACRRCWERIAYGEDEP